MSEPTGEGRAPLEGYVPTLPEATRALFEVPLRKLDAALSDSAYRNALAVVAVERRLMEALDDAPRVHESSFDAVSLLREDQVQITEGDERTLNSYAEEMWFELATLTAEVDTLKSAGMQAETRTARRAINSLVKVAKNEPFRAVEAVDALGALSVAHPYVRPKDDASEALFALSADESVPTPLRHYADEVDVYSQEQRRKQRAKAAPGGSRFRKIKKVFTGRSEPDRPFRQF